jgi:DNA-binding transcriptional regulator YhcF (GntR family)
VAIARGDLKKGDPLPTVRQLAADLGINLNTVSRAYRSLEASGLVMTKRGRGTVVAADRDDSRGSAAAHRELTQRLRIAFSDSRLGGMDREEIEAVAAGELDRLWRKEG